MTDDLSWLWTPDTTSPLQQAQMAQFPECHQRIAMHALTEGFASFARAAGDMALVLDRVAAALRTSAARMSAALDAISTDD